MNETDETKKPEENGDSPEKTKSGGPELLPLDSDMSKSRLFRSQKHKTKKNFVLFLVALILLGIFLAIFGIQALIRLSLLVEKKDTVQEEKEEKEFIPPPLLTRTFSATSSAEVGISGTATSGDKIRLFLNGKAIETKKLTNEEFTFPKIKLQEGVNTITVKAIADKNVSDFSNEITITYIKEPPTLEIQSPNDKDYYSKDANPITISGKTDPKARITVNDFWAAVDGNGTFKYTYTLKDGENTIKIIAKDEAGNKTEKELTVTYSP